MDIFQQLENNLVGLPHVARGKRIFVCGDVFVNLPIRGGPVFTAHRE